MSTKRDQIIEQANKIFLAKGYSGASMRDIAAAVGMEASSLYNHVESKHDILQTVCFEIAQEYQAGLDEILDSDLSIKKKLKNIIQLHIFLAAKHKDKMVVFDLEWKHLENEQLVSFKSLRKAYEQKLLAFITYGIEQKKLNPVEPKYMLYTFLSGLKWVNYYFQQHKEKDIPTVSDSMITMYLKGFYNN